MIRILLLISSLASFAYSLVLLADYWEYEEGAVNVEELFKQRVSLKQLTTEIDKQIAQDNLDEARSTVQLAMHFNYPIDYDGYRKRIDELDTLTHRAIKNAKDFASGFTSGKGNNGAGITGAMASDFTVVGDARDLHQQYQNHQAGKNVNELIVTLSGIGIGLTAATIGSLGTVTPVKVGTSMLKFASKSGKISKRFSKELIQKTQKAFDWNAFIRLSKSDTSIRGIKQAASQAFSPRAMKSLTDLTDQANNIRKATSTIDTIHLLKYVENADDLRRIEKVALKQGKHTKGIMKFLGRSAIRGAKVLKKTFGLMVSLLSLLLSGILSLIFLFPSRTKKSQK